MTEVTDGRPRWIQAFMNLFLRLWLQFSFRQMRRQAWRTLAVLLGIAVGSAVFSSVRLSIEASLDSFSRSMDRIAGRADRVVVYPGGRVPEQLVSVLARDPSVQAASPILSAYVRINAPHAIPVLLLGFDPILDRPLRQWGPDRQGSQENPDSKAPWLKLLGEPYTLFLGQGLKDRLQAESSGGLAETIPDGEAPSVRLSHLQHTRTFRVLGTLAPQGLALVEGGQIALTDIATFQEFTGLYGVVDRIDLLFHPRATPQDLARIRSLLPQGVSLEYPSESKEMGRMMIRAYQLNLSVLSFVSLFVGMFLVYSLVSLHAGSRRHELAILRSIGASSRLVFLLFMAEGAFFGVVGWVLAIPLSTFMVRQLLGAVSSTITHLFVRVHVEGLRLVPSEVALSFFVTLAISLLAAFRPAWEAMRVAPREVLLMHETCSARKDSSWMYAALGLGLIALVWPVSKIPGPAGAPVFGYLATFFLFCGFSLLSPLALRAMGAGAPSLLKRIGGQPAYLGGRTIRDSGARLSISVGALITAIALFVALSIMVHSFRATVGTWVEQTITGDLFLRPRMSEMNHYRDPVPVEIMERLSSVSRPLDIMPYRRIFLRNGAQLFQFEPIDFEMFTRYGRFILLEGDLDDILPDLIAGRGVMVSEVFANQSGLHLGDRFRTEVEGLNLDVPILAVFRDYRTQGGVVHYSLPEFAKRTGNPSCSGARLYLRDHEGRGRSEDRDEKAREVRDEILRVCGDGVSALELTVGSDLRREIMRIFDETFSVTTLLLLIALMVAALGIATTLAVLVLERTPQVHTLLAAGASAGQVRAMVFWEAVLMVFTGECLGLACGYILSILLILVINRQSFGWTFLYRVDWTSLLASIPLILATALLAAIPAAHMVLQRSPATVLRER